MSTPRKLPPLRNLMDAGHKRIADVIGVDAACELSLHFGGERLLVARAPQPSSRLVRKMGMPVAEQLGAFFGKEHLDVPLATPVVASYLDRRGIHRNEIARILKRGRNQIRTLLMGIHGHKDEMESSQLSLLD